MTLLLTMLPIYLLGNIHCLGMCGPLVMMIGKHEYRYFYFLGRLLSFTLAGTIAGLLGAVLNLFLNAYHLSALLSFLFGSFIILIGIYSLLGRQYPGQQALSKRLSPFNNTLSLLILQDRMWPAFFFGFFTIALPCGQTLIVFSACALSGSGMTGMINGLCFAALTSPSLWIGMHLHAYLKIVKHHYNTIMGVCAILIGLIALLRGFAEIGIIAHLVLNESYHIVIY